ncbi:MAG: exo-alpha-sialidase [Acutalibacteraceae bacterium]
MLFAKTDETYSNFRIPGLVLTEKGTLLGCCECRRGLSDWSAIDLTVRRSTDKGKSWTQTVLIPGGGATLNNPVLTVLGRKILFMFCMNYKRLFICESEDDGQTFTKPREINGIFANGGFFYNAAAIGPGHGVVKDGTVIIPVWFAYNRNDEKSHHPSFISTVYSVDGGESWRLGEIIGRDVLLDPSECAAALWQGRVVISIRNENRERRRAFAVSKTGFSDWSEPLLYDNMPDPVCMGSMDSNGGELFHINCDSVTDRVDLTLKISRDCFKSFESIIIDESGGYADIAVGDKIYVLYEKNFGEDGLFFCSVER